MDTENKKREFDEKKDVEKTELLIALPALINNIREELKLSEDQLFSLNTELSVSILEDQKKETLIEKIEGLFLGNIDDPLIDKIIEKTLLFFDGKDYILASEKDFEEISKENSLQKTLVSTDSKKTTLEKLTDPLIITPTTTAPIKREYGDSAPAAAKPVVDPYREIPEK